MQSKEVTAKIQSRSPPPKNHEGLRRVYSDDSGKVLRMVVPSLNQTAKPDTDRDDKTIECECCGMSEDCTPTYISRIKAFFCGKWVCGLCAEAVKEKMRRTPTLAMEEALGSHAALCKQFKTTRLNPKLSLAGSMREIARKSSLHRLSSSNQYGHAKIGRSISCIPRIDGC